VDNYQRAVRIHEILLQFYGYPEWRNPLPPLDELISTILSQNTNDINRDRAFEALKKRFSTWEAVRDANEDLVIDTIRIAGLANRKGPRILNVLKQITLERGLLDLDFLKDLSPQDATDWLIKFNGVGPKTAAIVLLFSLKKPAFPVDTHIYRVSGRIGLRPKKMNADQAHKYLEGCFSEDLYYPVHLNMIRLGREICLARNPKCNKCPLFNLCDYYSEKFINAGSNLGRD